MPFNKRVIINKFIHMFYPNIHVANKEAIQEQPDLNTLTLNTLTDAKFYLRFLLMTHNLQRQQTQKDCNYN